MDREHTKAPGIYIKLAKKASGTPSITAAEAVEVCLCFGWIDGGGGGTIDDKWWLTRYTPRRPKSMWSKKNTDTVARLTQGGKMRPAGIAAVETAKADGRWDRAYDGPANISVPDDLAAALAAEPTASVFFSGLNSSCRYAVLHRVQVASVKARAGRIQALVQMLAAGNIPGRPASSLSTADSKAGPKKATAKSTPSSVRKKTISKKTDLPKNLISRDPSTKKQFKSKPASTESRRPGLRPRG